LLGNNIKSTILFIENSNLPEITIQELFKNFNVISYLNYNKNEYSKKDVTHIYTRLSIKLDGKFLSNYPNLKFIGCPTTSIDHIDTDFCHRNEIKITTIRNQKKLLRNITSTAELATWFLIELSRNPSKYANNVLKGKWNRYEYVNESLNGKTLGIIGLGRVGKQVARVFLNLGMRIIFFDSKKFIFSRYKRVSNINQIAEQSDFITIHVNGVIENNNLIARDFLSHLKSSGSYIVNTSRGLVVNEVDIVESLTNGNLVGYATDVLDGEYASDLKWLNANPLWKKLNLDGKIVITPHIGGATVDSLIRVDNYVLKVLSIS
jgi:lactate dehydrogenase-like 2-hydroxyacid dehydrogenase